MRRPTPLLGLTLAACIPTTRQDTQDYACYELVNGNAELGDLTGWKTDAEHAVAAVRAQEQSDRTVTPNGGEWFFSFAVAAGAQAGLVQACSPAPQAAGCTLTGRVQTEGLGDAADHGVAALRFLDGVGLTLAELISDDLTTGSLIWRRFDLRLDVPPGAQEIQVSLTGTAVQGDTVNVYWDDLALHCDDGLSGAS